MTVVLTALCIFTQTSKRHAGSKFLFYREPLTGMSFTLIKKGSFEMGSPQDNMGPLVHIWLTSFWMGTYVVTNKQYEYFDKHHKRLSIDSGDNEPVVNVSYNKAKAYAKWLSHRTHRHFHLPSEAQWEYAARGGLKGKDWPWGNEGPVDRANVFTGRIRPVGSYPPNNFGLYDMSGNVWEYVLESWHDLRRAPKNNVDPIGPTNKGQVVITRGGSYLSSVGYVWFGLPAMRHMGDDATGFRLALDIKR